VRVSARAVLWAGLLLAGAAAAQETREFWAFESGHVRPLALSPSGDRLYAVNTPDNRLEVFEVSDAGLRHLWSVAVGLEPVAVALRSPDKAWVVNHLSDDVSIVDVASTPPRVVRTLLVGDEPTDVVFASGRAFVATARRGQNTNIDPAFLTPAVDRTPGRALVFVYDPNDLGTSLAGDPLAVVGDGPNSAGDSIFSDSPRALAVSNDGTRVYVAAFHSGNQTTTIGDGIINPDDGTQFNDPRIKGPSAFAPNLPTTNAAGDTRPPVGAIFKYDPDTGTWLDDQGRDSLILSDPNDPNSPPLEIMRHSQPDFDVFEIDAAAATPSVVRSFAHVGTILFNMAVHPVSGLLYVSNTDANNLQRFEGPGTFCASLPSAQSGGCSSLRGHLHESRITLIDVGTTPTVTPRHLNKHLAPYTPATDTPADNAKSLAIPLGMAISTDGATLYQAAFGSSKIGVFQTAQLADDSFVPSADAHIELSEGGPSGIVLDEARSRLYVATRFGNSVTVVDLSTQPVKEHSVADLSFDPEPAAVRTGRRFLYDARFTSSNGEAACASCHVFGNFDSLGWDLGNPDGARTIQPNPFVPNTFDLLNPTNDPTDPNDTPLPGPNNKSPIHPMKGPMTTQSLRGMANHGPMHWRGDRTGGLATPPQDPLSEFEAFMAFNVAFEGLLGRSEEIPLGDMQAFTNFILEVAYPPNPFRALSNEPQSHPWAGNPDGVDLLPGQNIFTGVTPGQGVDTVNVPGFQGACNFCHTLNEAAGFFGSAGTTTFEGETQHFKVAHLRNIYAKTGFFGIACISSLPVPSPNPPGNPCNTPNLGEQIRGFGVLHDGSVATILDFVSAGAFAYLGTAEEQNLRRRELADYVLGFPSNLRPIVGQQVTLDANNGAALDARIDLMITRSLAGDCDLVVKGRIGGEPRGWQLVAPPDTFESDLASEAPIADAALRALALEPEQELTYTCAPPGSGPRIGVDRNRNLVFDANECGDVNADGVPAAGDSHAVGRALAGLSPNMLLPEKCNVRGAISAADADGNGVRDDCDLVDRVLIARAGLSLGGAAQVCERAL
jgi:DNA-binding beta-propeller fold protein YncE